MIGKGKSITHTLASIKYGWNQEKDGVVIYRNNIGGDSPKEIAFEFERIQKLNTNCKNNTMSFVISPTIEDGEKLKNKELKEITSKFIKEMNLGDRQAISFVHRDKDHTHLHLYVNRVDFDGKAYNDSFLGKRSQHAAENIAKELNFKTVKDIQLERLNNLKLIRKEIYNIHKSVIKNEKVNNITNYINELNQRGVKVIPSINKSKQLQGFRYKFKNQNLKASEVHRDMGCKNLIKDIYKGNTKAITQVKKPALLLEGGSVLLSPNIVAGIAEKIAKRIVKEVITQGI